MVKGKMMDSRSGAHVVTHEADRKKGSCRTLGGYVCFQCSFGEVGYN